MTDVIIPEWKVRQIATDLKKKLEWHEDNMKKAANEVAKSLKAIHDEELYKAEYPSFEEYCENRLKIGRARGYQILNAQSVREMLAANDAPSVYLSDKAALAVKELPEPERVEIVKKVAAQGKVTERAIRIAAGTLKPAKAKVICKCPHCGEEIKE